VSVSCCPCNHLCRVIYMHTPSTLAYALEYSHPLIVFHKIQHKIDVLCIYQPYVLVCAFTTKVIVSHSLTLSHYLSLCFGLHHRCVFSFRLVFSAHFMSVCTRLWLFTDPLVIAPLAAVWICIYTSRTLLLRAMWMFTSVLPSSSPHIWCCHVEHINFFVCAAMPFILRTKYRKLTASQETFFVFSRCFIDFGPLFRFVL
jgi:hypothetical protein